jgi:hypothetical protein
MKKIIIVLTALFLISCNNKELTKDKVIATWRGGQATLGEYEEFAHYYAFNYDTMKAVNTPLEKKREILKHLVNFKLIELLADSLRLDTMKVMKESYARKLGGVAWQHHLYPDSVTRKVIKEEEVKALYEIMKYEYDVSHILITNKENGSDKNLIDSLYSILNNDPSQFSSLAEIYSEDKASAVKGGNLGWSVAVNYVPEFEKKIITLNEGKFSEPFQTQFGYHIAYLIGKRKNASLGSYENAEGKIKSYLSKVRSTELEKANSDFYSFLYNKYGVKVNDNNISGFVTQFNDLLKSDKDIATGTTYFNRTTEIASYEGKTITYDDAIKYFSKIDRAKHPQISEKPLRDFIFTTFQRSLISKITYDLGYQSKPEVISLAKEGMLVDYKEYFTDKYLGNKKEMDRWYNNLYSTYNVNFFYDILEYSFYKIPDDRK